MRIDIRDSIPDALALKLVLQVVKQGKISQGENGKMYYCWMTTFDTDLGEIAVSTRQYRKSDCFVVYKPKQRK